MPAHRKAPRRPGSRIFSKKKKRRKRRKSKKKKKHCNHAVVMEGGWAYAIAVSLRERDRLSSGKLSAWTWCVESAALATTKKAHTYAPKPVLLFVSNSPAAGRWMGRLAFSGWQAGLRPAGYRARPFLLHGLHEIYAIMHGPGKQGRQMRTHQVSKTRALAAMRARYQR